MSIFENSLNIVIAGEAGQGIELAGKLIAKILHGRNYHTFFMPEYMSRIKGGCNSSLVKVSSGFAPYYELKIDILFALNDCAVEHLGKRVSEKTVVITQEGATNLFVVGYVLGLFGVELNGTGGAKEEIGEMLSERDNSVQLENGYNAATAQKDVVQNIKKDFNLKGTAHISANEALGKGVLAGGCNFAAFYPMSPSTNMSQFLCDSGVNAHQVEDEICAINMALGAVYAGARAMVPTSGGGFALMCEGVSLCGMIESPIVINIAQRPAPATGLPTRDAQEDLNLALYSGHGEFPRIILSGSTFDNSFQIGAHAFNLSEKFQVPVFILSQQGFLESEFAQGAFKTPPAPENHIVKSNADYKRYDLAQTISPRAIPNNGEGLVCVDSDEHDEFAQITEDYEMRKKMVEKRLRKMELIKAEFAARENGFEQGYEFAGSNNYENLIISWGGNFHTICAAIKKYPKFALLHIIRPHPLPDAIKQYIQKAKRLIAIEQNATGQLAQKIENEFDVKFDHKFLKYSGEPIAFEEVADFLSQLSREAK